MSNYVPKENSGSLWKNEEKKKDSHADYTGKVNIDGALFWINGWIKETEAGKKFLSLSFRPVQGGNADRPRQQQRQRPEEQSGSLW